jgi:hypothetical protein
MGDLAKRFSIPTVSTSKQSVEEFVAAQLAGEASEELSLAETALAKLQATVKFLTDSGDPDFKDALGKKEKEITSLKEKVVKLQAKEEKPGTKGEPAAQRIRGIQSRTAGGFTTAAQRGKEGAAKGKLRMENDIACIDESIAELMKRKEAVTRAHAESAVAHDKLRVSKEEFASAVDTMLAAKAQAAADSAAGDAVMAAKGEGGAGQDVGDILDQFADDNPFDFINRKAKGIKEEDFPKLIATPTGADLEVLNNMHARYATLGMGAELPWFISYEQLGATVEMAKNLLGQKCWSAVYTADEQVTATDLVPRHLAVLIGLRINVARTTHLEIKASEEKMALARAAMDEAAAAEEEEVDGWAVKRPKRQRRVVA